MERLRSILKRIDGKGYKAYKDIEGNYAFGGYQLTFDHVQGDPFAAPSRISIRLPSQDHGFDAQLWCTPVRRLALEDYLTRALAKAVQAHPCPDGARRGSGKSGLIDVVRCGQQILQRNAVMVDGDTLEARITVGLPAAGRSVLAGQAIEMLFKRLPRIVDTGLTRQHCNHQALQRHLQSLEQQTYLRHWIREHGLVAFVADGAILPRRSGIDDRPLRDAVPFQSPPSMQVQVELPGGGCIRGMGIKTGVNLVVGGGFHGKSTLLKALEYGVYDHIPGDGREQVVTDAGAVKIRAEDGRKIHRVNISAFITGLPLGRDTEAFSTDNASGSTSQAANIIEALQANCRLLLIDEDTSATNFMIRDRRMQSLVNDDREPITPLLFRIRELYERHGVSSVIVMGGSGDYFSVADTVIMLDAYRVRDETSQAKNLARAQAPQGGSRLPFALEAACKPPRRLLDASRGHREFKQDVRDHLLVYGEFLCDLGRVEQIVDAAQMRAIGLIMHYYPQKHWDSSDNLFSGLKKVFAEIERSGLDVITRFKCGDIALPRIFEVASAVNRLRERPA